MIEELKIFSPERYSLSLEEIPKPQTRSPEEKNLKEITEACSLLSGKVQDALEEKGFPLTLGGDHSIALGSIFGSKKYCEKKGLRLGVIWFDAHADMNTPKSSETGNIHGMPLSTVLGMGHESLTQIVSPASFVKGEEVALIGLRSVDEREQIILDESSVYYQTMESARRFGIKDLAHEIKTNLIDKVDAIHFSFDLDVMDPSLAPSVSTPEKRGMLLDEFSTLFKPVTESGKLLAFDLVEYNPLYEKEGRGLRTCETILRALFPK